MVRVKNEIYISDTRDSVTGPPLKKKGGYQFISCLDFFIKLLTIDEKQLFFFLETWYISPVLTVFYHNHTHFILWRYRGRKATDKNPEPFEKKRGRIPLPSAYTGNTIPLLLQVKWSVTDDFIFYDHFHELPCLYIA